MTTTTTVRIRGHEFDRATLTNYVLTNGVDFMLNHLAERIGDDAPAKAASRQATLDNSDVSLPPWAVEAGVKWNGEESYFKNTVWCMDTSGRWHHISGNDRRWYVSHVVPTFKFKDEREGIRRVIELGDQPWMRGYAERRAKEAKESQAKANKAAEAIAVGLSEMEDRADPRAHPKVVKMPDGRWDVQSADGREWYANSLNEWFMYDEKSDGGMFSIERPAAAVCARLTAEAAGKDGQPGDSRCGNDPGATSAEVAELRGQIMSLMADIVAQREINKNVTKFIRRVERDIDAIGKGRLEIVERLVAAEIKRQLKPAKRPRGKAKTSHDHGGGYVGEALVAAEWKRVAKLRPTTRGKDVKKGGRRK